MRRFKHADLFNFNREGCFGTFTVMGSERQSIFYTSTVFRISELDYLKTAKDVLTDQVINFDAMIQRDIVPKHVEEIEEYLSAQSSTKDVRFFPPLLVALIGYHNGTLDRVYEIPAFTSSDRGDELTVQWGDVFQCRFGIPQPHEQVRTVQVTPPDDLGEKPFQTIAYLSTLQVNTEAARLVVVDGQHRLRALQALASQEDTRPKIEPITVPACIVWPPWAYETGEDDGPDVIESLRRIFVDVNSKAKQVSGHFSILLKDDHIAAIAIREFCERMRQLDMLHYVEWNQHVEERAYQLTWFNKVTSVGIVWQALVESGAPRAGRRRDNYIVNRVFPYLLQLAEVRHELDAAGTSECNYARITNWDRDFTAAQRDLLRQQLRTHFAPCLVSIFTQLRPFVVIEEAAQEAFSEYEGKRSREYNAGIMALKTMSEPEVDSVVAVRREIHDSVRERVQDISGFAPTLYRTQRFQQGLLSAYYYFVDAVTSVNAALNPRESTERFIGFLNTHVFEPHDLLFEVGMPWLENVVTQGSSAAVIKRQSTRQAVCQLLLSRLGCVSVAEDVATRCCDESKKVAALQSLLVEMGDGMAAVYIGEYRRICRNQFIGRLDYDESLDEDEIGELQALQSRAHGDDKIRTDVSPDEAHGLFLDRVGKIVDGRIRPHVHKLTKRLGYTPTKLSEFQLFEEGENVSDEQDDDS